MPAIRSLTEQEEQWIRSTFPRITSHDVAEHLQVHVHTAIRILVRLGLIQAPCPKYQQGRQTISEHTKRTCLVCKQYKVLNHNQHICGRCRSKQRERGLL